MNKGNMQSVNLDTSKTNHSSFSTQKNSGSYNPFSGINAILGSNNAISLLFDVTPKMIAAAENKHSTSMLNDKNAMYINEIAGLNGDLKNVFNSSSEPTDGAKNVLESWESTNKQLEEFNQDSIKLPGNKIIKKQPTSYYEAYTMAIEGKYLNDIVVTNPNDPNYGKLQPLTLKDFQNAGIIMNQEGVDYINNIIAGDEDGKNGFNFIKLDEQMIGMNFKIEEVVDKESGYNAVVLSYEDKAGAKHFDIINSETNSKEIEDLAVIAYTLLPFFCGEFTEDVINSLLSQFEQMSEEEIKALIAKTFPNKTKEEINELYLTIEDYKIIATINNTEELYYKQIEDNEKIIDKYVTAAASSEPPGTVELFGYSLGGGLMSGAYASYIIKNPENDKYISSICLYNPYVGLLDQYKSEPSEEDIKHRTIEIICERYGFDINDPDKYKELERQYDKATFNFFIGSDIELDIEWDSARKKAEDELTVDTKGIIDVLSGNEKYTIFVAEGDIVSLVSDNLEPLLDNIVCFEGKELSINFNFDREVSPAKSNTEFAYMNCLMVFNYIIGSSGCHSLDMINEKPFNYDEYGNLKSTTKLPTLFEVLRIMTGKNPNGNNDYNYSYKIDHKKLLDFTFKEILGSDALIDDALKSFQSSNPEIYDLFGSHIKKLIKYVLNNFYNLSKRKLVNKIIETAKDAFDDPEVKKFIVRCITENEFWNKLLGKIIDTKAGDMIIEAIFENAWNELEEVLNDASTKEIITIILAALDNPSEALWAFKTILDNYSGDCGNLLFLFNIFDNHLECYCGSGKKYKDCCYSVPNLKWDWKNMSFIEIY